MEKTKNPFIEPNKLIAVLGYVFFTLFGGAILIIVAAFIYNKASNYDLSYTDLMLIIGETDFPSIDITYQKLYVMSNALGNMLSYLCMIIIVVFFMRNYIIEDGKAFLRNRKRLIWMIPLFAVAGYIASYVVDFLVTLLVKDTSVNQSTIQDLILHGGAIPMFIAVVICAPIVEELIYRKAVFEYLKKKHIAISYVVSILIFTLPHMITTFMAGGNPLHNFLLSTTYAFSGFLLCLTYHICDKNIYASWFMHFINNLLAFIIILALGV